MLNKSFLLFLITGTLHLQAQQEKSVASEIRNVTVFLNNAQVTRTSQASIETGKTDLVFRGLAAALDPQSIQVSGKGNFIILGTTHRQNFLSEFNRPKALQVLVDSLALCQKKVQLESAQKSVLDREEQLLLANQKISGNNLNLSVTELKSMADFFRTRLTELSTSRMRHDDQIRIWNDRINRLSRQIAEQNELLGRNTGEIVVSVQAEKTTTANLEVSYIVSGAGWTPVYDLRASGLKDPVTLNYKASIQQATGEDWKNVRLKLSTANPNLGGLKPELYPWYLDFLQPMPAPFSGRPRAEMMKAARANEAVAYDMAVADAQPLAELVTVDPGAVNVEFIIGIPQTIPSASKPVLADIRSTSVPSHFEYAVTPKLDKDAFLLARITGWEELNLLPGEASIFFEGTYVGKTMIDPKSLRDTLTVSMGRDSRIVVTREKLKDMSSRKLIGSSQRESQAWEIGIRNTKAEPIRIVVEDQFPVSQNSQIELVTTDAGGGKVDGPTGKITWTQDIAGGATKKLVFRYELKYPKDKKINGF
ncbi:MAG: DUF4139 domain-containing protein [Bacteroidota bacterium]